MGSVTPSLTRTLAPGSNRGTVAGSPGLITASLAGIDGRRSGPVPAIRPIDPFVAALAPSVKCVGAWWEHRAATPRYRRPPAVSRPLAPSDSPGVAALPRSMV